MPDRPDLLSTGEVEHVAAMPIAPESRTLASEVLLAREVIARQKSGELVWAWESEWCWRADEFSPLVPLADVRPLDPIPAKGRQGLWTPDADLLALVADQ